MSAFRFRPSLESLDQRLNPSSTAPIVKLEYILLAPAATVSVHDDVVVDGKIITAENNYFRTVSPTSANGAGKDDTHKETIEIASWSLGASNPTSIGDGGIQVGMLVPAVQVVR